tara:strand:- start:5917 stop:7101 length:1185 start_codon:yes stop_codon:yes gene_type:complete
MKNSYQKKIDCSICGSLKLEKLINLKKFPITGIFVKKKIKQNFPYFFNQSLNICKSCGHIQLENFVDPELLYNNFYSTRTSENHLSKNGINFFKKFVFDVTKKKKLGNFMEIGCNDIQLINSLKNNFSHLYGVDPIWISKRKIVNNKITIIGDFIEKLDFKKKIKRKINIFASTHNLEHIESPYKVLKKIVDNSGSEALFFIEVPDADLMIKNLRFDQVFHQHYHYFNINSLSNLINKLNCKIIKKKINPNFWGGSLLIAFKKNNTNKPKMILKNNFSLNKKKITKSYLKFKSHYDKLKVMIKKKDINIGYGAGQMTPSFAYHLKSDLNFLEYIVDDNKKRNNKKYPFLKTKIKFFNEKLINNKKILITALDGTNPISKKLKKLKTSFVNPLSI